MAASSRRTGVFIWALIFGFTASTVIVDEADGRRRRKRKRRRRAKKPKPIKPWQVGVSKRQRRAALKVFRRGNKLLLERQHKDALELYVQAEKIYPHPNIQYNMVRCLMGLERWLEAYTKIKETLRYGRGPLKKDHYEQARSTLKILEGRVAWITVRCAELGAVVTLNGEALFTAPGEKTLMVKPGRHVVVAKKAKFVTATRDVTLTPSKKHTVVVKLMPLAALKPKIVMKRRWKRWIPWVVLGAGVVVAAAVGVPLFVTGQGQFQEFDSYIKAQCSGQPGTTLGCDVSTIPDSVYDYESKGKSLSAAGIAMLAAGGAALAAGVTLVILNRARPVEVAPAAQPGAGPTDVTVVPTVVPGGAAVQAGFRF